MRVAIVAGPYIPVPPKQYGGIEQVIHYLIRGLKESGHTVILLAPGDSVADCELIPITPKALYFPRHKKDLTAHQKLVNKANKVTIAELNKIKHSVDIIHSHGFDMSKITDVPTVTTLHNTLGLTELDYFLKRKNLAYVSISKNQQLVCPELNYIDVVYNGEDPDEFPIVTSPKEYVCFLGRFDRDKNPHMAIQLAISLGLKIKLGGKIDHNGDEYFDQEIKPYLHHPLVEYVGELNFEQKVDLLSNAKCNLHPTNFREPFGLTVLEAAYCGTPTLAVDRGSMPELIEPGRTGILVEDFIEGRQSLEECFNMDRSYIASRARQLFNYKIMAKQYIVAYKKVVNSHVIASNQKPTVLGRLVKNLQTKLLHKKYRYKQ